MADTLRVEIPAAPTTAVAPTPAVVTTPATPVTPAVTPATPVVPVKVERPAWLPQKFKDTEQLAQAYTELEKRMGGANPEPVVAAKVETPAAVTAEAPAVAAQPAVVAEVLGKSGIKFDELQTEFNTAGKLSDASFTKLEAAGFPKAMVESWVAGQQSIANSLAAQVHDTVGGKENYARMVTWAAANLAPEAIATFNKAVNGGVSSAQLAVKGLAADYTAANGQEPTFITANNAPRAGAESFRSRAEMTDAMRDPRYSKDPAYRADVEQKALRSEF